MSAAVAVPVVHRSAPGRVVAVTTSRTVDRTRERCHYEFAAGHRRVRVVQDCPQTRLRPGDTVARLGGDEFAVLLPAATAAEADAAAVRLLHALRAPVELEGVRLEVRASVGVAVAPEHGCDLD